MENQVKTMQTSIESKLDTKVAAMQTSLESKFDTKIKELVVLLLHLFLL